MRSRTLTISVTVLFLTLVVVGSLGLILSGYSSYTEYRNPYSYVPTRPASSIGGMGMTPFANYTVMFVLDGVRSDIFWKVNKPNIVALGSWANYTNVEVSHLISVSLVGYSVLSSGVNSSESLVTSNEYNEAFHADSLWNVTLRHAGTTACVGSDAWWTMFGPWMNYSMAFSSQFPGEPTTVLNSTSGVTPFETTLPDYRDSLVADYSGSIVEQHKPTFMVVHFGETDEAAHTNGSVSTSYATAIANQDTYIGQVLTKYQAAGILGQTLVVVVADHGHVDIGGHGGIEPEVLHIPMVLRGPGVLAGVYSASTHQNALAPTIAAVMGWEVPSDCSGTVLFDCLNLTLQQEAIYRINLGSIRLAQAEARLAKMGYTGRYQDLVEAATQSLSWATSNFTAANYASAISNAVASESTSRAVLRTAWEAKVAEEITMRLALLVVILAVLVPIICYLFYRSRNTVKAALRRETKLLQVTASCVVLYFALLALATVSTGQRFSASYFPESVVGFLGGVFVPTLLAFCPTGIVLLALLAYLERGTQTMGAVVTWAAVALISITTIYVSTMAFFIIGNGPGLPWYAPDVVGPITYFYVVISNMAFTIFSLVAFLGGLGVAKLLNRGHVAS
jgi:hypothetical protein